MQVGCNGALWRRHEPLVQQVREQSLDGTLTEVLGMNLLGWRVIVRHNTLERGRRDTYYGGEEDYELNYEDYGDYEEGDDDDDEGAATTILPVKITETTTKSTTTTTTTTKTEEVETHPHRHHHGELPKVTNLYSLSFTN